MLASSNFWIAIVVILVVLANLSDQPQMLPKQHGPMTLEASPKSNIITTKNPPTHTHTHTDDPPFQSLSSYLAILPTPLPPKNTTYYSTCMFGRNMFFPRRPTCCSNLNCCTCYCYCWSFHRGLRAPVIGSGSVNLMSLKIKRVFSWCAFAINHWRTHHIFDPLKSIDDVYWKL